MNQNVPSPGNQGVADTTNYNGVIFALAERNQTDDPDGLGAGIYVSTPIQNSNALGVRLFVTTTSSTTGTLTVKIQNQDPVSRDWFDLPSATTVAINDPADVIFTLYPGVTVAANTDLSNHLGMTWRVHATVGTAAVTFSIGAVYLG